MGSAAAGLRGAPTRGDGSAAGAPGLLADKVAKWWLPERWTFIDSVPKTSVGKFDKKVLRRQYADDELVVEELTS
jgi:fatty-acyl-CoA synthase